VHLLTLVERHDPVLGTPDDQHRHLQSWH
jgi:hypothetical protein